MPGWTWRWGSMPKTKVQCKFTVNADIAATFKARCANEGASMASVIQGFMKDCRPVRGAAEVLSTHPHRKKAVSEIIGLLNRILELEADYCENIPEQFYQRREAAEYTCGQLSESIACLEDAF